MSDDQKDLALKRRLDCAVAFAYSAGKYDPELISRTEQYLDIVEKFRSEVNEKILPLRKEADNNPSREPELKEQARIIYYDIHNRFMVYMTDYMNYIESTPAGKIFLEGVDRYFYIPDENVDQHMV